MKLELVKQIVILVKYGIRCDRTNFDAKAREIANYLYQSGYDDQSEHILAMLGDIPTMGPLPYRIGNFKPNNLKYAKEFLLQFAEKEFNVFKNSVVYMVLVKYCSDCNKEEYLYAPTYETLKEIIDNYDEYLTHETHNECIRDYYFEIP